MPPLSSHSVLLDTEGGLRFSLDSRWVLVGTRTNLSSLYHTCLFRKLLGLLLIYIYIPRGLFRARRDLVILSIMRRRLRLLTRKTYK